jgi:predicted metalloendopeptidase
VNEPAGKLVLGESIADLGGAKLAYLASNLPAFQGAFQCKADAPMVRKAVERCEV